MYKDDQGHFTSEENNGGKCPHNVKREYRQNTPYEEILQYDREYNNKKMHKKEIIDISEINPSVSRILKREFNILNNEVVITEKQYESHIDGNHDDFYAKHIDDIPKIIKDPDFVFQDNTHKNGVIFVGAVEKTQIIVALNSTNKDWKNTIITVFGCGDSTLKRLLKKNKIFYKKNKKKY